MTSPSGNDDAPQTKRILEVTGEQFQTLKSEVATVNTKLDTLLDLTRALTDEMMRFRQDLYREQVRGKRLERLVLSLKCVRDTDPAPPCEGFSSSVPPQ